MRLPIPRLSLLLPLVMANAILSAADAPAGAGAAAKKKKPTGPVAHMVIEQKWLCKEDFSMGLPGPGKVPSYRGALGDWRVVDGHLDGKELAENHHSSVLFVDWEALPDVMVMRYDFRLGDANEVTVMGVGPNKANGDKNRITFALGANHESFWLTAFADDTVTPAEPIKAIDRLTMKIDPAHWYTMTMEINGDEAIAYLDDSHVLYGRHPTIAKFRRTLSFRTSPVDKVGSIDNLWVTGGVVDTKNWDKMRPTFAELAAKRNPH